MTHRFLQSKTLRELGAGAVLFAASFLTLTAPVSAASGHIAQPQGHASPIEHVKIFKRGRTPRYPSTSWVGPRGREFYFGFVPYEKGNIETQAIQRMYPEANYPPGMRYWTPRSNF